MHDPSVCHFRLLVGNFQPLAPPDPFDPLVVHQPARMAQQRGNLTIAVAAILAGKLDNVGGQTSFIVAPRRHLALRRTMLSERRTRATLGDVKVTSNMIDALTPARGA